MKDHNPSPITRQATGVAAKSSGEASEELANAISHLDSLALGWDCGALCEEAIVARFQAELDAFQVKAADDFNLRHIRAALDARDNAKAYRKDAAALRVVLAALLKALSHQPPRAPDEPGDRAREDGKSLPEGDA